MAKGQEQGKAVAGIDLQRARLGISKPAFGNQIIKKGVQPLLADVRCRPALKRKGNCWQARGEIGWIIGENTAATGLLPKLASESVIVVDFAPKRRCHTKPALSPRLTMRH